MKNYSDITESLDITTKQYVDQGLSSKADISELDKRVKLSTANATVGATDKPIYVKNGTAMVATDVMKEAFLQWGGKNFSADYGPLDAALISDLGADRFAFIPAAKWQVEYSRDNGATWQDYEATDAQKLSLTSVGTSLSIGKATSENKATADYKLRLTLTTTNTVYSVLNKFAIDVSTSGSTGCYVTIEGRTKANVDAGANTWVTFAENIPVSGWSGWNIINTSGITTHGNTNNQYANLRFTFGCTGGSSTYPGLQIRRLKAFGGVGWQTPSNMAQYGSLYRYDYSQNALFPADVYIQNNIKVASINDVHNGTLTIQKNGTDVQTFSANQSSSVTANITVPTEASDVNALSLDGGTINKSKTIKMDASANSDGANLKWGTVNHKNPYIGYASDQSDGTFIVSSLLGTNYASGLAIGGGSGNLLWKGAKVATTSDIPAAVTESTVSGWGFTKNTGTVTGVKINGETKNPASGVVDLGTLLTAQDISGKANLSGGNTFTGKQTFTDPPIDNPYSIDASGYVKGSLLQSSVVTKKDTSTDKVCVFISGGFIYYRTPAEIVSDGGGATTDQIHNGTLTIKQNGTTVQTFSANQSGKVEANITVPTFSFTNGVLEITT